MDRNSTLSATAHFPYHPPLQIIPRKPPALYLSLPSSTHPPLCANPCTVHAACRKASFNDLCLVLLWAGNNSLNFQSNTKEQKVLGSPWTPSRSCF